MMRSARSLNAWLQGHPGCRVAYVHGERHGLWWEFRLSDSFRWQGHIHRMHPAIMRQRMQRLAAWFGLTAQLDRPVEELTAAQRGLADLAVALLPHPDLLIWEAPQSPFAPAEMAHVVRLVDRFCRAEGIAVRRD